MLAIKLSFGFIPQTGIVMTSLLTLVNYISLKEQMKAKFCHQICSTRLKTITTTCSLLLCIIYKTLTALLCPLTTFYFWQSYQPKIPFSQLYITTELNLSNSFLPFRFHLTAFHLHTSFLHAPLQNHAHDFPMRNKYV